MVKALFFYDTRCVHVTNFYIYFDKCILLVYHTFLDQFSIFVIIVFMKSLFDNNFLMVLEMCLSEKRTKDFS